MNDFTTILTFTYLSEVYVIKGRLESEGVECFIKDELTTQVNPFYSNAIGGIKLQVKANDLDRAIQILKEGGYLKESTFTRPKYWHKIDDATSNIPFFNKMIIEFRVVTILTLFILIIFLGFYYLTRPKPLTMRQRLTADTWCVNNLFHKEKAVKVNTTGLVISLNGYCPEDIQIRENGDIVLPGINTHSIWGKWTLKGDKLFISDLDTLQNIYGGEYSIDFYGGGLTLQSPVTTIYAHV